MNIEPELSKLITLFPAEIDLATATLSTTFIEIFLLTQLREISELANQSNWESECLIPLTSTLANFVPSFGSTPVTLSLLIIIELELLPVIDTVLTESNEDQPKI